MGLISGLIAGGATVAGGLLGRRDAKQAEDDARNMANFLLQLGFDETKAWRHAGEWAANRMRGLLEEGPGEFRPEEQPGYKYGYQEFVEKPTLRSAAVRGRLFDPSTQKALGRGAQDYASMQYDNFLNRYYQKLQPLMSLSEAGRSSTHGALGQGVNAIQGMYPYQQGAQMGGTNALLAMMGGLSNIGTKAYDWYQTQNMLNPGTTGAQAPANQLRWSPRQHPGF